MELTNELKQLILLAIKADRENFSSDGKHAIKLQINKAVYSLLKKGNVEQKLSNAEWIRIARILNVSVYKRAEWKTAPTPVFQYITGQLDWCRKESSTGLFCDECDIGKSHAAKQYAQNNKNVVYVDCSLVKTKQKMIRHIASQFGVDGNGKLLDVIADLIYYVKTLDRPLIIIDEAGDLDYLAFLELKAMYNALEDVCGFYMLGAEGLEAKMRRAVKNKKVGYAEIFSRFGARYQTLVPTHPKDKMKFKRHQASMIATMNFPSGNTEELIDKCDLSLRRIKTIINNQKKAV